LLQVLCRGSWGDRKWLPRPKQLLAPTCGLVGLGAAGQQAAAGCQGRHVSAQHAAGQQLQGLLVRAPQAQHARRVEPAGSGGADGSCSRQGVGSSAGLCTRALNSTLCPAAPLPASLVGPALGAGIGCPGPHLGVCMSAEEPRLTKCTRAVVPLARRSGGMLQYLHPPPPEGCSAKHQGCGPRRDGLSMAGGGGGGHGP